MKIDHQTAEQLSRYSMIGISSVAIELVVFFILASFIKLDIRYANPIALTSSTVYNFTMSKTYTFRSKGNSLRSLFYYLVLFAFNQFFTTSVILIAVDNGIPLAAAKMMTMACVVLWNYVLLRSVVFKD